jgi:hypothetical protein
VRNTNKAGGLILSNYFTMFPLFSAKRFDCLDWQAAMVLYIANAHHGKPGNSGLLQLAQLKSQMNDSRTTQT